jgi:DNA excision repair protein ERCC-5
MASSTDNHVILMTKDSKINGNLAENLRRSNEFQMINKDDDLLLNDDEIEECIPSSSSLLIKQSLILFDHNNKIEYNVINEDKQQIIEQKEIQIKLLQKSDKTSNNKDSDEEIEAVSSEITKKDQVITEYFKKLDRNDENEKQKSPINKPEEVQEDPIETETIPVKINNKKVLTDYFTKSKPDESEISETTDVIINKPVSEEDEDEEDNDFIEVPIESNSKIIPEIDLEREEPSVTKKSEPKTTTPILPLFENQQDFDLYGDKLEKETNELQKSKEYQNRLAAISIQDYIIEDSMHLLKLFGLPFISSPGEAEAQCAYLDETNQTDGTITEDSDIWLFGAKKVYRNFFTGSQIDYYDNSTIKSILGKETKSK